MDNENKLPKHVLRRIKPLLQPDEPILNTLKEVWVPRLDLRWMVLTDRRVLEAVWTFFGYNFFDYDLDELDVDLALGFPFDRIDIIVSVKKYSGHFYWFRRADNLKFYKQLTEHIRKRSEREDQGEGRDPVKMIQELAELKKQGIITEEEYQLKKKKLFEEI